MELPEITILAGQMEVELVGKMISEVEVSNEKCLNTLLGRFQEIIMGKKVASVVPRGKWVFIGLEPGYMLLFNTGMGADVIHFNAGDDLPEKYQIRVVLDDESGFTVRVWWFCYLHLVSTDELSDHRMTADMGLSPLDEEFTLEHFRGLLAGRRGGVKSFLMNQKNIAGIGNVYIQDILFGAGLHPLRTINTITEEEIATLYGSMKEVLTDSIEMGGLAYERDFYGRPGGYGKEQYRVAYKEGLPCPVCGAVVEKIKTGSTASFICPSCQRLK